VHPGNINKVVTSTVMTKSFLIRSPHLFINNLNSLGFSVYSLKFAVLLLSSQFQITFCVPGIHEASYYLHLDYFRECRVM
jgi:hypothetical protein